MFLTHDSLFSTRLAANVFQIINEFILIFSHASFLARSIGINSNNIYLKRGITFEKRNKNPVPDAHHKTKECAEQTQEILID